jgi:hypothetical protein
VFAILASVLMVLTAATIGVTMGIVEAGNATGGVSTSPLGNSGNDSSYLVNTTQLNLDSCYLSCLFGPPGQAPFPVVPGIVGQVECYTLGSGLVSPIAATVLGPACAYAQSSQAEKAAIAAIVTQYEYQSRNNTITLLNNVLNVTAASFANINASWQELLSYFEDRAEAIVPYFLGLNWNQTTQDQIIIDSGLASAIEGIQEAMGIQTFQDWNGTASTFASYYGPGCASCSNPYYIHPGSFPYPGHSDAIAFNTTGYSGEGSGQLFAFIGNQNDFNVSQPWEAWRGTTAAGFPIPIYFNMAPGGNIVCAPVTVESLCPTYTVYDLTKGTSYTVPDITIPAWQNQTSNNFPLTSTLPLFSTVNHIGQFDLLKLACTASCSNPTHGVFTSNSYAFINASNPDFDLSYSQQAINCAVPGGCNTMTPLVSLMNGEQSNIWVPSLAYNVCMANKLFFAPFWTCKSTTGLWPTDGFANDIGSGPAQAVGGNATSFGLATTLQELVNNTMTVAQVEYVVEQAMTDAGRYSIPADCSIPPPSAGFPSSVNPADYNIGAEDGVVLYLGYLNSVGKLFDVGSTQGIEFCNDPNLGLTFNWTGSWYLTHNITASVYLTGTINGTTLPVYPNGSYDPTSTYSNYQSWPVVRINPTLLFPYEYQWNVPLGMVQPVPANDPTTAMLVNYSANNYYGSSLFKPAWGVPTYLALMGHGNLIWPNGTVSSTGSGYANDTGDAIYISACLVDNVTQNPCQLGVTFFDQFTYGHVSGLVGVSCVILGSCSGGGGGGLGSLGADCGFGNLDQWYDGWAGYLGSAVAGVFSNLGSSVNGIPYIGGGLSDFFNGIGCLLGWVVIIIVFILLFLLIVYIARVVWRAWRAE